MTTLRYVKFLHKTCEQIDKNTQIAFYTHMSKLELENKISTHRTENT